MKRLGIYLVATFAISWGCWWTLARLVPPGGSPFASPGLMTLYLLGGFGPTIGAGIAVAATPGAGDYLARLVRWRVSPIWWIAALAAPVAFSAAHEWVAVWTGGGAIHPSSLEPLGRALVLFPTMIIGGGLEELGWRGVAQPALERGIPRLAATLAVGAVWAVWHLPLFSIPGVAQGGGDFSLFAAGVLAHAFVLAWVYARTGSILLCVLCHAASNTATAMGMTVMPTHATAPLWAAAAAELVGGALLLALGSGSGRTANSPVTAS